MHFEVDLETGVTRDFDLDKITALGATVGESLAIDLGLGLDLVAFADDQVVVPAVGVTLATDLGLGLDLATVAEGFAVT